MYGYVNYIYGTFYYHRDKFGLPMINYEQLPKGAKIYNGNKLIEIKK